MVEKLAVAPWQTVAFAGPDAVVLALTVSVAAVVLALPQALVKTARYLLPLCDVLAVKLSVVLVAPEMFVKGPPVLTCHCTVGAGLPLEAAVKLTGAPSHAVVSLGFVVTVGAVLTGSVAAVVVAVPPELVNTARY